MNISDFKKLVKAINENTNQWFYEFKISDTGESPSSFFVDGERYFILITRDSKTNKVEQIYECRASNKTTVPSTIYDVLLSWISLDYKDRSHLIDSDRTIENIFPPVEEDIIIEDIEEDFPHLNNS